MSWTDEMTELFEDLSSAEEFRATMQYPLAARGTFTYLSPLGSTYVQPDGSAYFRPGLGAEIVGVKMALSMSLQMSVTGYTRKADTAFDCLRSDAVYCGLYANSANRSPATPRPEVTINDERFQVVDIKDDDVTDPTVKLVLASIQ